MIETMLIVYTVTQEQWLLIIGSALGIAYAVMVTTGLDREFYKMIGWKAKSETSVITHSISSLMPTTIQINGVEYSVPPMDGIQSVKVDPKTKDWYRIINYSAGDGTHPLKITHGRLTVDVNNPQFLEGLKTPLIYLSDSDLDSKEITIEHLKGDIKDLKSQLEKTKEELREARRSKSYQSERQRQRRRGVPVPSSRQFPGNSETTDSSFNDDEDVPGDDE
jgi:hypothetical protein